MIVFSNHSQWIVIFKYITLRFIYADIFQSDIMRFFAENHISFQERRFHKKEILTFFIFPPKEKANKYSLDLRARYSFAFPGGRSICEYGWLNNFISFLHIIKTSSIIHYYSPSSIFYFFSSVIVGKYFLPSHWVLSTILGRCIVNSINPGRICWLMKLQIPSILSIFYKFAGEYWLHTQTSCRIQQIISFMMILTILMSPLEKRKCDL